MKTLKTLAMNGAAILLLTCAATSAPVALKSLSNPPGKIATARVVDEKGIMVGAVQRVELDINGRPSNLEFALLGTEQIIAPHSSNFSYDERKNALVARLDKSQIVRVPSFIAREGLVI
jgi:hypothetical protein